MNVAHVTPVVDVEDEGNETLKSFSVRLSQQHIDYIHRLTQEAQKVVSLPINQSIMLRLLLEQAESKGVDGRTIILDKMEVKPTANSNGNGAEDKGK